MSIPYSQSKGLAPALVAAEQVIPATLNMDQTKAIGQCLSAGLKLFQQNVRVHVRAPEEVQTQSMRSERK
ncbi:MAG: hypothetical protein KGI54_13535 [Pseudomonadota bacterium]|nr:hypothetical protein [Pseudomonadota bacterium]